MVVFPVCCWYPTPPLRHNNFPSRLNYLPYSRGRPNDFWSTEDENPTLLQYFHWYYPDGGQLWPELAERAGGLNDIGINMVWLPPAYKGASGGYSVGYDSYDLFDLGEFDQREPSPPNTAIKPAAGGDRRA